MLRKSDAAKLRVTPTGEQKQQQEQKEDRKQAQKQEQPDKPKRSRGVRR